MEIITSDTPAVTAGVILGRMLERYKNTPTLLLLSGGSALSFLDHVPGDSLGSHLTITTLDERFSTDSEVNNFEQIKKTQFYKQAKDLGVSEISTVISTDDTLESAGKRFDLALHDWKKQHPNGVVLATMGIGSDGHTAGIFPGNHAVDFHGSDWAVAYEVSPSVNAHTKRITVTHTFLSAYVSDVLAYAVGTEKKSVIAHLENPECPLEEMPACIIAELPSASLVTDA